MKNHFLITGLVLFLAACGGKNVKLPKGEPISPFESLPVEAYGGKGVASLKKLSLRAARDVAYAQANRELAQDIFTVTLSRVSEFSPPGKEPLVRPMSTVVSQVVLVGKKFSEERRVGDTLWVRLYMSKAEVDESIGKHLQSLAGELLTGPIRERLTREVELSDSKVEEELKILADFQRRQFKRR
ncbi:hypothetical protein MYX78_01030 [Acidobacteria bacterium AH-259-G07]|nr:hypothetical protein [Acidobacteria bacterium AH-259-G07]